MLKSILLLSALTFTSLMAVAQGLDLKKCGQNTGYRPGGSSVVEARYAFNTELEILLNGCTVQAKLINLKDGYYYIRSFNHKGGKTILVYDVIDFADPLKPMGFTCTLTQVLSYKGSVTHDDSMQETLDQTCTDPIPAK